MAKYNNCSKKYLLKKGLMPILGWLFFLVVGFVIFLFLNKRVAGVDNIYILMGWVILTFLLTIGWIKKSDKIYKEAYSWLRGIVGENRVKKELMELSDDYHIFHDCVSHKKEGNIDFIVVCSQGVFVIEVKNHHYFHRFISWKKGKKNGIDQVKRLSKRLKIYLESEDIDSGWVQAVLVFVGQKKCPKYNDCYIKVLGRGQLKSFFNSHKEMKLTKSKIKEIVNTLINKYEGCHIDF